jgi:hypothetical protein
MIENNPKDCGLGVIFFEFPKWVFARYWRCVRLSWFCNRTDGDTYIH